MSNPYSSPGKAHYKPHRLRNPKTVTIYHLDSGKYKTVFCFKFDVLKNEKGQISDYVATVKETKDWLTAAIFPAKYWCTKEEWEKRKEAMPSLPKTPAPAVLVAPAATVPDPVATAPPPTLPPSPEAEKKLTFTSLEDEEVSPSEMAALDKPKVAVRPLSLDEELPGEYNPKAHAKDKFALGKPEDLVMFTSTVEKNLIDQEAKRKIAQMQHRKEMGEKLMQEKAAFMADHG